MTDTIEQKCLSKGVKLTDQRKIIAKVMSEATDHPDVDELYNRVSMIDQKLALLQFTELLNFLKNLEYSLNMSLKVVKQDMKN